MKVSTPAPKPNQLNWPEESELLGPDDAYRDLTFREMIRALIARRREARQSGREARRSTA